MLADLLAAPPIKLLLIGSACLAMLALILGCRPTRRTSQFHDEF